MSQIFYIHVIGILIIFTAELSSLDNVNIMVQTSCYGNDQDLHVPVRKDQSVH